MALIPRQISLYTEFVDLYKPVPSNDSSQTYTLEHSNIQCLFVPTPNFDESKGVTRLKQNSFQTSDALHFHSEQEISDDWVIFVRTTSTRQKGKWKRCIGAGRELPWRAMAKEFFVMDQKALTAGQIV